MPDSEVEVFVPENAVQVVPSLEDSHLVMADPLLLVIEAVNRTFCQPASTVGVVGLGGAPAVTCSDSADAVPSPATLTARTLNLQLVPLVSVLTV